VLVVDAARQELAGKNLADSSTSTVAGSGDWTAPSALRRAGGLLKRFLHRCLRACPYVIVSAERSRQPQISALRSQLSSSRLVLTFAQSLAKWTLLLVG
jgi:hypothetical protein